MGDEVGGWGPDRALVGDGGRPAFSAQAPGVRRGPASRGGLGMAERWSVGCALLIVVMGTSRSGFGVGLGAGVTLGFEDVDGPLHPGGPLGTPGPGDGGGPQRGGRARGLGGLRWWGGSRTGGLCDLRSFWLVRRWGVQAPGVHRY